MTYLFVDERNQGWLMSHNSADRFFKIHGGNKVSIIDEDGQEQKYEKLPDGSIIQVNI